MGARVSMTFFASCICAGVACETFETTPASPGAPDAAVEGAAPADGGSFGDAAVDADDGGDFPVGVPGSGCADGTREAFAPDTSSPTLAGCAGRWSVAGLDAEASCNHKAGNDGSRKLGTGCAAADLCATGWQVCNPLEVSTCGSSGAMGFYASAARGAGNAVCGAGGDDDVFGCAVGLTSTFPPPSSGCGVLNAYISKGKAPLGWDMGTSETQERANVANRTGFGGVLCCKQ
ncbi:MAG: hypothetical protein HOO96_42515 [Polyangiaceae bacterium]|nr:hypothetical protein [Polyangiaceae bacterium]